MRVEFRWLRGSERRQWTLLLCGLVAGLTLFGCGGGGSDDAPEAEDGVRDLTGRWRGIVGAYYGSIDVTQNGRSLTLIIRSGGFFGNTVFRGPFDGERIVAESGDYIMELSVFGERMFGYIGFKGEQAPPPTVYVRRRTAEVPE